MKQPIKRNDIRVGDLVRWESPDGETAHEFRRGVHGHLSRDGQHYLLERPKPKRTLPFGQTLGWLRFSDLQERRLAMWSADGNGIVIRDGERLIGRDDEVYEWIPAVAVPKAALDEWRRVVELQANSEDEIDRASISFLAAVDAANGDDR